MTSISGLGNVRYALVALMAVEVMIFVGAIILALKTKATKPKVNTAMPVND